MAGKEKEPKTTRTLGQKVSLFGISFVPIIVGVLMLRAKWIGNLLAYPLYLSFLAFGVWVGYHWHKLVRLDNDSSGDPADDPTPGNRFDWLAMISAILVGFGIMFFLRALASHEMARAFANVMPSHDDD